MAEATIELIEAICHRLAELLEIDEAGWPQSAHSLDHLAFKEGIELGADYDSPRKWAESALHVLRAYVKPDRFPPGPFTPENYETAEDLFCVILPDWRRIGL